LSCPVGLVVELSDLMNKQGDAYSTVSLAHYVICIEIALYHIEIYCYIQIVMSYDVFVINLVICCVGDWIFIINGL